jgi:16S rRNA A1518/A1519 N6-dimethyltransferase RsmA/KsgA/DIM1 with predicted DNA glycosylase/AP lyase activity
MTVFSHFFSEPEYMFKIDRYAYFPSPEVHGALAVFTLLPPEEREHVRSVREFQSFVRQAFSSKRKKISNSLQPRWLKDDINAAIATLGLAPTVRVMLACSQMQRRRDACLVASAQHCQTAYIVTNDENLRWSSFT